MILLSPEKIQEALFAEARKVGVPEKCLLPTTDMNYDRAIAKAQLEHAFRIIGEDFVEPVINFYVSDGERQRRVVELWQQLRKNIDKEIEGY